MNEYYYLYDYEKKMVIDVLPKPYFKAFIVASYADIFGLPHGRFITFSDKAVIPT